MKRKHEGQGRRIGELLLPVLVLAVLLFYSYARFYGVGYLGFQYNRSNGRITDVYVFGRHDSQVFVGDILEAVDGDPLAGWTSIHYRNPLSLAEPGQFLKLSVTGTGGTRTITWQVPGYNTPEFLARLVNTWAMSFVFWLAGTATLFLLRPKDVRWALLVAFNYLTAIWVLAGTMSTSGIAESAYVMRAGIWLSLPVYLHLHWIFPQPLKRSWPWFWPFFYLAAGLVAVLQWMEWFPTGAYSLAFIAAVVGSVLLLGWRAATRSSERRDVNLLFFAALGSVLPTLALAIANVRADVSTNAAGYIFSMLGLPGAYFYVVYRRQLGGLEFRANRVISVYLFLLLLVTIALLILPFLYALFPAMNGASGVVVLTAIGAALFSIVGFDRFQGFVERRLLRIPLPPKQVQERFAGRISTSFSRPHLVEILTKETLPSFLIQQSALLDFSAEEPERLVYAKGVGEADLPSAKEQHAFMRKGTEPWVSATPVATWVRAAFPLVVNGEERGLWLLGRKDPDDQYFQAEINSLRSLADQLAIALTNLSQAQRLRALFQADVERQETERVHLARELHDDTLGRINELGNLVDDKLYSKGFGTKLEALVAQVRNLMNSLRPPLLDHGLYYALQDLVEELPKKAYAKAQVRFEMALSNTRFDPKVEQHVYRIVQQAAENALKHSHCKQLTIAGAVTSDAIQVTVEDNGRGFILPDAGNLTGFLATHHYGLAGMDERANMIGARLRVETRPGAGTRVTLLWPKDDMHLLKSGSRAKRKKARSES